MINKPIGASPGRDETGSSVRRIVVSIVERTDYVVERTFSVCEGFSEIARNKVVRGPESQGIYGKG